MKNVIFLLNLFAFSAFSQIPSWQWAKTAGGQVWRDVSQDMVTDSVGNSYVVGYFGNTATFGSYTLGNGFFDHMFIAKYDNLGNVIYAVSYGPDPNTGTFMYANSISFDSNGDLIIVGVFRGTIIVNSNTYSTSNSGNTDFFIAKFDKNNGAVVWFNTYGGLGQEIPQKLICTTNEIFVCGFYNNSITIAPFSAPCIGIGDIFLAKFNLNGGLVWARTAGGNNTSCMSPGMSVDGSGNIYITGAYDGQVNFSPFILNTSGSNDIFLVKYSNSGNVVWAKSMGGTSGDGCSSVINKGNKLYLTGGFTQSATFGTINVTGFGISDIFVASYDTSGNELWVKVAGGSSAESGEVLSVWNNTLFVSGTFGSTPCNFDSYTLSCFNANDVFLVSMNISGSFNWALSASGSGTYDRPTGIGTDLNGNCYLTGIYDATISFGSNTLNCSSGTGLSDIFIAKALSTLGFSPVELNSSLAFIAPNILVDRTYLTINEGLLLNKPILFIYDNSGRVVRRQRVIEKHSEILKKELSSGLYTYVIHSDKGIISYGKLIIE